MVASQPAFNPFPGLRPFKVEEDYLFFGRETQTNELLQRLRHHHFLAVVGTSGSGKSSLARAGLLAALHQEGMVPAGINWRVAVLSPGNDPIGNLAKALTQQDALRTELNSLTAVTPESSKATDEQLPQFPSSNILGTDFPVLFVKTMLKRGRLGLVEVMEYVDLPPTENLLIVVDQFEELFRFKQSFLHQDAANESAAFVKLLLTAASQDSVSLDEDLQLSKNSDYSDAAPRQQPGIYIVLTMRSEFIGRCSQFRDLPEAINRSQYLVPRMTRDQLRAAIVNPISVGGEAIGGASITPRLLNQLLNDVGDNPDQLPILQHALMRTWNVWLKDHEPRKPIDLRHYDETEGMEQALSKHANEIYDNFPNEHSRNIAEVLFKRLTEKSQDGQGLRHPTQLSEICLVANATEEEVLNVIEAFRQPDCSFLMPSADEMLTGEIVLDISHESLMRIWDRLRDWVEEEGQSAQTYRDLKQVMEKHQKGEAGLLRDPELTINQTWYKNNQSWLNETWATRYADGFDRVVEFLKKSQRQRQQEILRGKVIFGVILTSLALAIAGLVVAFLQYREAKKGQLAALGSSSAASFNSNDQLKALTESLEAGAQLKQSLKIPFAVNSETQLQVLSVLRQRIYDVRERNRLNHSDGVSSISFRSDGQTIATASYDKTVKLWDRHGKLLNTLDHEALVRSAQFSRNGQMLASASDDGIIKLWSRDGKLVKTIRAHEKPVYNVSFSPDGTIIASASADNTIKLWNLNGKLLNILKGHSGRVNNVNFSPDGQTIASASRDMTIKLWNRNGTLLKTLPNYPGTVKNTDEDKDTYEVESVSFSPDGRTLASAGRDKSIKLWSRDGKLLKSVGKRTPEGDPIGHTAEVYSVVFSPDGQALASASADGTVKLWSLNQAAEIEMEEIKTFRGHSDEVVSVSFSPDGRTIASASLDTTARLWSRDIKDLATVFQGHKGEINRVSFSPDGQTIASASADRTIKLWSHDGKELKTLGGHDDKVTNVSFSLDGKIIASASSDKTIKLWSLDGKLLNTLLGHNKRVNSVNFSPDGQTIVSASSDKTVKLWNRDGTIQNTLRGHKAEVLSAGFSPDGQTIISASADHTIQLWSRDGRESKPLEGHADSVNRVSFSPDGQTIASASSDKTIRLWSHNGEKLKLLRGHSGAINSVSFSHDGQMIVSSSNDKTVKLWSVSDGKLLTTFQEHFNSVSDASFRPDNMGIVSASLDGTLILWDLSLDNLLAKGCSRVQDYLRTNPSLSKDVQHLCVSASH